LLHSFNRSGIQSESQAVNHPNVAGRPWSSTISQSTQVLCVLALRASSVYWGSGEPDPHRCDAETFSTS
jgi:hypothetical protein